MTRHALIWCAIFSTLSLGIESQFTCDPATDCLASSPGSFVPNPDDCTSYYVCTNDLKPSPSALPCGDGFYFDTETAECVAGVDCEPCSGSSTVIPKPNTCILDCNQTGITNIPVAGDCNSYYRCNDAAGDSLGQCPPETPYFNGQSCVDDENQCCYVCLPFCTVSFELVPDPTNCNGYVFCLEGTDTAQVSCDANQYFDVLENTCVQEDTPCVSYCADDSSSSTPSTDTTVSSSSDSGSSSSSSISTSTPTLTSSARTTSEPTTVPRTTLGSGCYEDFECPVDEGSYTYCNECIQSFWQCDGGEASLQDCTDTFVFDYTVQECIPEEDCPTFGVPTDGVDGTTGIDDCYLGFECPVANGEYTYCNFCTPNYYSCDNFESSIVQCEGDQVFDYTIQECVDPDVCPTFG